MRARDETSSPRVRLTVDGVGGVRGGLVNGSLADELLAAGECHTGRREAVALVVGDDIGAVALAPPHGDARVGCPQIDANRRLIALRPGGSHRK